MSKPKTSKTKTRLPVQQGPVTLEINSCRECPHAKEGMSYSLDGWDRGNDWTCTKADNKQIASFVERPSEKMPVPSWCPLRKPKP